MDLTDLDWGSVPAWLGAVSLLLAFRIFRRDRSNTERSQIDLIGAWTAVEYERTMLEPPRVVTGTVKAHIRNASQLPVRVVRIAYKIESFWMVEDLDQSQLSKGGMGVWTGTPGTESSLRFHDNFIVAPQDTVEIEFEVNVEHMAPGVTDYLAFSDGISAKVEWLLVIDNAGRRWEVHPERGGKAVRVGRRWRRSHEHMPQKW